MRKFLLPAAIFCACTAVASAQQVPQTQPAPQIGQVSKDSVWVPTPERMIRRMLQLADVGPRDTVIDLGSGDGRIPIHAARHFGARAVGVELEENLVRLSEERARAEGVAHLARFVRQDLFEADLSRATVIALYISPGVMTRLKPRLLALAPGTRVVSHHFTLDGWDADESVRSEGRDAYLWVVPADVRGHWKIDAGEQSLQLRIEQDHQQLTARGERAGRAVPVLGARLRGGELRFTAFDADGSSRHYSGRIEGARMRGQSEGEGLRPLPWSALRE
jgi:SAM-dependent methyltransferase